MSFNDTIELVMTTIIVHGTLAKGATWYWNSWGETGFCRALAEGMEETEQPHDIWRVGGQPVGEIAALNPTVRWHPLSGRSGVLQTVDGRFEWTGTPEGLARGAGAVWLVKYLNALSLVSDEPIRIVAHSHGCNVVKLASSLPDLSDRVFIEKAVFLACPHFWEEHYEFEQPETWQERLDVGKQMSAKQISKKFRYQVAPGRFGQILNLYSSRDKVQIELSEKLSGTYVPLTGGFLQNLGKLFRTLDVFERPQGTRTDEEPGAVGLYENLEVSVAEDCSGTEAHSALHGAVVGKAIGRWLNSNQTMDALLLKHGQLPALSRADTGA